jgi:hypothetical protein
MPPRKARRAAAHSAGDPSRVDQVGGQIGANAIQNKASKQEPGRGVPTADDPSALSVSDGVVFAGTIVPRHGSYFAFDIIGMLVGVYPSTIAAMRALPKRGHT